MIPEKSTSPRVRILRWSALGGAAFVGAATATALMAVVNAAPGINSESFRQLDLFGEVFEKIHSNYVTDVEDAELVEGAINGMLATLDPHSTYLTSDDFESMRERTSGEFGGLGIEVIMNEDGFIHVVAPIDDTPAFRAGIIAGDLIIGIDGESVQGMTQNEAIDLLKGAPGTDVTVTIAREEVPEPFDVDIVRDVIVVQSVRSRVEDDDIAYIRIADFSEKTEEGLRKAFKKFERDLGEDYAGIILDLRSNPGGLLDQAVAVSDLFLSEGAIVETRGRNPRETERYNARRDDLAEGKPIVVLINGGSASASEIVAGALQDLKRATIIGTKSFGKGSVQTIIPLQGGMDGALRLTTARYYTPSGRSIQAKGIDPDIVVELPNMQGEVPHEEDLPNALAPEGGPAQENESEEAVAENGEAETEDAETPSTEDLIAARATAEELEGDYQLKRAIAILRGVDAANTQAMVQP